MNIVLLSNLLQQYSDQFGDISALTALLNTKSIQKTDSSRKLMGDVKKIVGSDATRRMLDSLDAASASDALIRHANKQFTGEGLDFTDTDVRDALDTMAANIALSMTTDDANAVKNIGIWYVSPIENEFGVGESVTSTDVTNAINVLQLKEWLVGKTQDAITQIENLTLTSQASVLSFLGQ